MITVSKTATTPSYVPDYMAASIDTIDFDLLKRQGIKCIAFDADSTLVPYRGIELSPQTTKFLHSKRKLFNKWCIASNRVTNDLEGIANDIDAGVVRANLWTRKPRRRFFKKVFRHLGAQPHEVAMIGDKIIADIWGGNRAGCTTVWVERLGRDSLPNRLMRLRAFERQLLKRYL